MSVAAMLPPVISKEVRALALPWLAILTCMLLPVVTDAPIWLGGLSVPAYFLGTAALGGLSVGHEYTDRTLSLLLTLPARRERLFAVKLGVLAVMLLTLWVAASTLVFGDSRFTSESKDMAALLPVLCGLFLAPWLTMACRNPIGGAVFALAVPGVLLVAGELIGISLYGQGPVMQAFRLAVASFGTIGLCAVGAVMGWWTFTHLEAIEGPGEDVRLPRWLRSADTAPAARFTRRNPFWLLVKKEIALQQLPLVLAAFYVLAWFVAETLTSWVPGVEYRATFTALTLPYALLLTMVIGSSASAAERQIGTLEWQVLLPIAAWKQWAVKMAVVFGLAIILALGLPVVLLYLGGLVRPASTLQLMAARSALAIIILATAVSVYVSSLSRSGLRALVMSISATFGAALFMQLVVFRYFVPRQPAMRLLQTGFLIMALRFAFSNHRSAERSGRRVATQVILMAAFVTTGVVAAAVWHAFQR
jgi:ABC-type transport system involved in multi-copper enzyme maturation permease subunit